MIEINLNLFVTLAKYQPVDSGAYRIEEGTTIADLIRITGIPEDEAKLVFINGKRQDRDYVLQHCDRVGIFPPVGGG
ncbi:MAG: MoaD/ThiS family protein [Desulfobacteraceae bacterium]